MVGTEHERAWILQTFPIFDDDWRVERLKSFIEKPPGWLTRTNRSMASSDLWADSSWTHRLAGLHLHPGLVTKLELLAPGWGAGELYLQWFVKRDPAGTGLVALENFGGDLSSSAGILGIVYAKRPESVVRRVATKLASASTPAAQQNFLWSVADYASDPTLAPGIAKVLGLPAP